jgi:hypothetical protein
MPDVYKQAEEALIALGELEAQAREDARRNSRPSRSLSGFSLTASPPLVATG